MAFCRVMRGYTIGYREALALPIRTFWFMNGCINRLVAEEGLQQLEISAGSQSSEGYEAIRTNLVSQMGTLMKEAPQLDRGGLNQLKSM